MFFACFSCGVWYEAQQRYASTVIFNCQFSIFNCFAPLQSFPIANFPLMKSVPNFQFSILNFQFKKFSIKRRWRFLIFNILAINKNPFLRLLACEGERKFEETLHVFLGQILAFLFPPEFEEFDKT